MTIYETDNKEIIDIYNLYIEVKTFILKFKNSKQIFKEYYNLKHKRSAVILFLKLCIKSSKLFKSI